MDRIPKLEFNRLLSFFPQIELPVTLNEESIHLFQEENEILPESIIDTITKDVDGAPPDDVTEYIPCFSLPDTHDFHALVFWRASLMNYEYILVTFNKDGAVIQRAVIAGLRSDGNSVLYSVATIDPDWIIHIVEGIRDAEKNIYKANTSRAYNMEVLATGEIIYLLNEQELLG